MTIEGKADHTLASGTQETRILFVSHLPSGAPTDEVHARFGPGIDVVDFADITAELVERFDPHFVVSPIMTPGFDILDVSQRLWQLQYRGAYRVLTEAPLPNPGLVLREVRSQCPGLDVDLLSMDMLRR